MEQYGNDWNDNNLDLAQFDDLVHGLGVPSGETVHDCCVNLVR